jgi:hypothetical protein
VIQGQAQRGILEFRYRYPGMYMFHAHVPSSPSWGGRGCSGGGLKSGRLLPPTPALDLRLRFIRRSSLLWRV